jgi:hypothetical protein
MMKKVYTLILFMAVAVVAFAQEQPRFSPERFDAEIQQFIVQEAHLTPQESAKFFPVYKEMQRKQRAIYDRMRQMGKVKPQDEAGCQKAIQEHDNIEVELKRIQQTYHNKFLDILPASKVYDVIKAEDHFHRRMLKRWSRPHEQK